MGDVKGGISVTIPFEQTSKNITLNRKLTLALGVLVLLAFIWVLYFFFNVLRAYTVRGNSRKFF